MKTKGEQGKIVIFSAPSGSGKTTIVRSLLAEIPELAFSVSCTTRAKRSHERDGVDYHFISPETFREKIAAGAFLEWEEVYEGQYYGTLESDLKRNWQCGKAAIFDLDVVGGLNLKRRFSELALAIFIKPPSLEVLEQRLQRRNTETPASISLRVAKAVQEMTYEKAFDRVLVNEELESATRQAKRWVLDFLKRG